MSVSWLECQVCGADCIPSNEDGKFWEDETRTCQECGTINFVRVDDYGEFPTAHAHSDEEVEDVGQNKCNGSCGAAQSWLDSFPEGTPCRWDCERANMPEKKT